MMNTDVIHGFLIFYDANPPVKRGKKETKELHIYNQVESRGGYL